MGLLEDLRAALTAEVTVPVAELEDHDGFFGVHVPAADRVFLDHSIIFAVRLYQLASRIVYVRVPASEKKPAHAGAGVGRSVVCVINNV
jgi:hypothetical protein